MRRTGKTTRKVDRCIQEFFKNKVTYLYEDRSGNNNDDIVSIFERRLQMEHPGAKYFKQEGVFSGIPSVKYEVHNL